jgi:hypothetical protein
LWGPPSRLFLFLQVQLQELGLSLEQPLAQALLRERVPELGRVRELGRVPGRVR